MPQSTTSSDKQTRIAIFASGSGSNALEIIKYFEGREDVEISLIVANKPSAGVLNHAFKYNIPSVVITKNILNDEAQFLQILRSAQIDFIALAGFLLLIPEYLVHNFSNRIVNIHPALLPKFGGKGMYGMNVHRAVKAANETESGITIHLVNKNYDEGSIVAQYKTTLSPNDSPEDIAKKVLAVEHKHYAETIDQILNQE